MSLGSNNNAALKKSTTFLLTKSSSMDYNYNQLPPAQPTSTNFPPKRPPLVEFPTSPQLIFGEEMLHVGHPQHPLSLVKLPDRFTCAGCREYGSGKRFVCQQCNFQLHDFCACAPPSLKAHPLHCQHQLVLFSKPAKGGISQSKCDVCHKASKGYAYRCSACSFQMHPCCAMLSSEMNLMLAHPHTLRLLPSSDHHQDVATNSNSFCSECNRKRSGRVYHCTVCDYHIHAVCAKDIINGLRENGIKPKDKPNMLGTAARLASQVMIDFIGGLIEGLAEGVGQAIVQDAAKGRSPNAVRRGRN